MPPKGKKSRDLATTDKFCVLIFAVHWETRKEAHEIVQTILKWKEKEKLGAPPMTDLMSLIQIKQLVQHTQLLLYRVVSLLFVIAAVIQLKIKLYM